MTTVTLSDVAEAARGWNGHVDDRMMVNFIRHQMTTYDHDIRQAQTLEERNAVRQRVYGEIAAAFPELAAECEYQMEIRVHDEDDIAEAAEEASRVAQEVPLAVAEIKELTVTDDAWSEAAMAIVVGHGLTWDDVEDALTEAG